MNAKTPRRQGRTAKDLIVSRARASSRVRLKSAQQPKLDPLHLGGLPWRLGVLAFNMIFEQEATPMPDDDARTTSPGPGPLERRSGVPERVGSAVRAVPLARGVANRIRPRAPRPATSSAAQRIEEVSINDFFAELEGSEDPERFRGTSAGARSDAVGSEGDPRRRAEDRRLSDRPDRAGDWAGLHTTSVET